MPQVIRERLLEGGLELTRAQLPLSGSTLSRLSEAIREPRPRMPKGLDFRTPEVGNPGIRGQRRHAKVLATQPDLPSVSGPN